MTRDYATRVLVFGGILLLLANMLLGEVFAVFISHVANGEIRTRWVDVIAAARATDLDALGAHFARIETLLDWRGRIMNTHSHVGAFGMLALLLACLQPLVALEPGTRTRLAAALVAGGLVQTVFVFTSHYTGAWALWISDLGAVLILAALAGYLVGVLRGEDTRTVTLDPGDDAASRLLARAGALLVLLGMLGGLLYAAVFTFRHEPALFQALEALLATVQDPDAADPTPAVLAYRGLNSRIAITAAAHSHAIEMGILMLLLAPFQATLHYRAATRLAWARVLVAGGYLLPFFIFNATIYGLKSAAFADLSGLAVIVALCAMLAGLVRDTGRNDTAAGATP